MGENSRFHLLPSLSRGTAPGSGSAPCKQRCMHAIRRGAGIRSQACPRDLCATVANTEAGQQCALASKPVLEGHEPIHLPIHLESYIITPGITKQN